MSHTLGDSFGETFGTIFFFLFILLEEISVNYESPFMGRGSSVGIATRYVLDVPGLESPGCVGGGGGCSAPVQTGPRAHPVSCTVRTESLYRG
jgi:hypothetical protein